MFGIGEDLLVGGAVRAGVPGGVFLLMAFLAVRSHGHHVHVTQANGFRDPAAEVNGDVAQLGGHAGIVAVQAGCRVLMSGGMDHADIARHLVAAGASGSMLRGVVVGRPKHAGGDKSRHRDHGESTYFQNPFQDRSPVPFQL